MRDILISGCAHSLRPCFNFQCELVVDSSAGLRYEGHFSNSFYIRAAMSPDDEYDYLDFSLNHDNIPLKVHRLRVQRQPHLHLAGAGIISYSQCFPIINHRPGRLS